MKRVAIGLSLPILALVLAASQVRADDTPIKIGVLVALSGPFADYGQEMLNGMPDTSWNSSPRTILPRVTSPNAWRKR